jgi:hypothetical protein
MPFGTVLGVFTSLVLNGQQCEPNPRIQVKEDHISWADVTKLYLT